MNLGELAINVEVTNGEKERLSKLLQNKSSLPFRILSTYAVKNQQFRQVGRSKAFKKMIKGFRPGNEHYYNKALKIFLEDLALNKAPDIGWDTYQAVVVDYLTSEKKYFQELMGDITVDPEVEGTTEYIFSEIFKNAYAYGVELSDIDDIYEIWPFPRIENYKELSRKFSNPDLSIRNKKLLKETQQRLESLKSDIDERRQIGRENQKSIEELKTIITSLKDDILFDVEQKFQNIKEELFNEIGSIESKQEDLISKIMVDLSVLEKNITNIESLNLNNVSKTELENELTLVKSSICKTIKQIKNDLIRSSEELSNFVDKNQCSAEVQKVINKIENSKNEVEKRLLLNVVDNISAKSDLFFDKHLQKNWAHTTKKDVDIKESEFLNIFVDALKEYSIVQSVEDTFTQHALLKVSNVILVNDRRVYNAWLSSLGWEEYITKISVSPRWSSPNDWGRQIVELTSNSFEKPCFIEIHDFDLGLYESYLIPVLKLLQENRLINPDRKIVLFISSQKRFVELLAVSEYARCIDDFSKNPSCNKEIDYLVGDHNIRKRKGFIRISHQVFMSWCDGDHEIDNSLLRQFIIDCQDNLKKENTELLYNIYKDVPSLISKYGFKLRNNKRLYESMIKTFTVPWVNFSNSIQ
jgi:hypothetical protein